jgi:hypothetical protein
VLASQKPAHYRLQCVVHRESVSGIIIQDEQIIDHTEEAAATRAKSRFSHLLAGRGGCAALRNDAGRIVWSTRQADEPADTTPSMAAS